MNAFKIIRQEKGYALYITLLTLLLVTFVGGSLLTLTKNTTIVTKSERNNQSSYYIAEAGLVETRAHINEIALQTYYDLKGEYEKIKDPDLKENYNLEQRFLNLAKSNIDKFITTNMDTEITYGVQFGSIPPESHVTVAPDLSSPLGYTIASVGRVQSGDGNWKEKLVTQNIKISMEVPKSTTTITKPGSTAVDKLKACYAVYSKDPINYAGGTVYGDIYSNGNITISNGNVEGSVYSDGNIITNRDIKGTVAAKGSLKIDGGNISGSTYGNGITISNGSVGGNLVSDGDLSITGGSISQNAIGENVKITNGTVTKNLVSMQDLTVQGGSVLSNAVSHRELFIKNYPKIGANAVAKENIYVNEDWFGDISGKYIYGNKVNFVNSNNGTNKPDKIEKRTDINTFLNQYPSLQSIIRPLWGEDVGCLSDMPKLPAIATAFPSTQAISPANETIQTPDKNRHNVIENGVLNVNSYIVRDTDYHLVMDRDMYFKKINFSENYTLKIDLQNQDRKIYVDDFNNLQGHIELINPGSLEIIIQNSFYSKGELNKHGNTKDLTIRYAGSRDVNLSGESLINGSFHIQRAPQLTVNANGIRGDLIVYGNTAINISGGSSVSENLILAPNASLSITGGGKVKGNVIAKSLKMDGGATITPPDGNTGQWEAPGSTPEKIEVPVYGDGENFLITDPVTQK
ncbi:hypothetical protein [Psychrobacillus sp. L4]|uniref:hypothetical protein n=1 Tax=Psychrobacillus sp. L4 TaxID=3236892 RepID=UPI0036F2073C